MNQPLLPTSCILLIAAAKVGIKVTSEITLPPRSPKDNWPIIDARFVTRTKYQYCGLVDTPEKSA